MSGMQTRGKEKIINILDMAVRSAEDAKKQAKDHPASEKESPMELLNKKMQMLKTKKKAEGAVQDQPIQEPAVEESTPAKPQQAANANRYNLRSQPKKSAAKDLEAIPPKNLFPDKQPNAEQPKNQQQPSNKISKLEEMILKAKMKKIVTKQTQEQKQNQPQVEPKEEHKPEVTLQLKINQNNQSQQQNKPSPPDSTRRQQVTQMHQEKISQNQKAQSQLQKMQKKISAKRMLTNLMKNQSEPSQQIAAEAQKSEERPQEMINQIQGLEEKGISTLNAPQSQNKSESKKKKVGQLLLQLKRQSQQSIDRPGTDQQSMQQNVDKLAPFGNYPAQGIQIQVSRQNDMTEENQKKQDQRELLLQQLKEKQSQRLKIKNKEEMVRRMKEKLQTQQQEGRAKQANSVLQAKQLPLAQELKQLPQPRQIEQKDVSMDQDSEDNQSDETACWWDHPLVGKNSSCEDGKRGKIQRKVLLKQLFLIEKAAAKLARIPGRLEPKEAPRAIDPLYLANTLKLKLLQLQKLVASARVRS